MSMVAVKIEFNFRAGRRVLLFLLCSKLPLMMINSSYNILSANRCPSIKDFAFLAEPISIKRRKEQHDTEEHGPIVLDQAPYKNLTSYSCCVMILHPASQNTTSGTSCVMTLHPATQNTASDTSCVMILYTVLQNTASPE